MQYELINFIYNCTEYNIHTCTIYKLICVNILHTFQIYKIEPIGFRLSIDRVTNKNLYTAVLQCPEVWP